MQMKGWIIIIVTYFAISWTFVKSFAVCFSSVCIRNKYQFHKMNNYFVQFRILPALIHKHKHKNKKQKNVILNMSVAPETKQQMQNVEIFFGLFYLIA